MQFEFLKKRRERAKKEIIIKEDIMTRNFPNLIKIHKPTDSKIFLSKYKKQKKNILRYTVIKFLKNSDKVTILKGFR